MAQAKEISISLPTSLVKFIESYKIAKGCQGDTVGNLSQEVMQLVDTALKLHLKLD
ncbi:MAG: hypothetical protein ACRC78_04505 [Planktothrix sp.]